MSANTMPRIRYLVVDVDGTMTDSGIYYDSFGNEWKRFSTRDAAGFFAAKRAGIAVVVLTGRECAATMRRMNELGVEHLYQNVKDKAVFLKRFMNEKRIAKEEMGYIGDDLNDLAAMGLAGFVACPVDACREVKEIADYISPIKGGYGAVRDAVEWYLSKAEAAKPTLQKNSAKQCITGLSTSGGERG